MQADRSDRIRDDGGERRGAPVLVAAAVLIVVALVAWLVLRPGGDPAEPATRVVPETPDPTPPRVAEPVAPDIPPSRPEAPGREPAQATADGAAAAPEAEPEPEPEPEPEEPPLTPATADPVVREALDGVAADGLASDLLDNSNLIERGAAAIDAMRRGLVPEKVLNLPRPQGPFAVRKVAGRTLIDPAGYRRYDALVASLLATPVAPLADAFRRFRPLLETAYGALGYAPDKLDNALIAALDRIIATPVIEDPIALEPAGGVWAYEDRELEGMKALEKQLLRTGPDNLRRLQAHARALRDALLEP